MTQKKNKNTRDTLKDNFEKVFNNYLDSIFALLIETNTHHKDIVHTFDLERYKDVKIEGNMIRLRAKNSDSKEISKISEDMFLKKTAYVIHNSHFCYLHTLFERFLIQLVEYSIRVNSDVKKKYIDKFNSIGSNTKYSYLMLINNTKSINDRISRVDDIAKIENGILNLCKILFIKPDNDKKGNVPKNRFYSYKNRYIEMKERNNLLKHRGFEFDKKYIKNIIQTLDQKTSITDLFKSLRIIKRNIDKKNIDKELIGKKVLVSPDYFRYMASTIIFLSSYFIYNACTLDKERESLMNTVIHGLLKISHEVDSSVLNHTSLQLTSLFGNFSKQSDIVQFNHILARSRQQSFIKKLLKHVEDEETIKILKESSDNYKTFANQIPNKMKLGKEYQKLMSYYLNNQTEKFLSHCFSMNRIKSREFQEWAIFQKYYKNKNFLSKFKSKYNVEFTPARNYV
jgi:hypothetical protein